MCVAVCFPRFLRRNDAKERPAGCGNSKNDCLTPSSTGQAFLVLSHEHQLQNQKRSVGRGATAARSNVGGRVSPPPRGGLVHRSQAELTGQRAPPARWPAYIAQRVLTESLCGVCPSPRRGCAGRGGRCGCGNARGHAGNARGHVAALPAGGPTCLESLSPAGGLGGLAEASRRPRMSESPRMSPTRRLLAPSHAGRCSRTRIPCSIAVTPDMVMRI